MRARVVREIDPASEELGAMLADLQSRIRDLEQADQAAQRSVDDGALEVFDDDGNLRTRLGKQPDGSFAAKAFGKTPKTPTQADVIAVPGGCVVEWDGTFEDSQEQDVQRVAIHVGEKPNFAINDGDDEDSDDEATEKAAILSPRGGSAFLALDPGVGTYYVRLTSVAEGGAESAPSPAVEVTVAGAEGAFYQDEFVLLGGTPPKLPLTYTPLDNSEHVYWNGLYQEEDLDWTRRKRTVRLIDPDGLTQAGDRIVVEYAFLPGEELSGLLVDWGAPGWSYRLLPTNTDPTDFSAKALDDRDWAVGSAAFGSNTADDIFTYDYYGGYKTHWPNQTRIWVRRRFEGVGAATVSVRCDNGATVYWNGVEIGSFYFADSHGALSSEAPFVYPVPAGLIHPSENVLAVCGTDGNTVGPNLAVLDIKVEMEPVP